MLFAMLFKFSVFLGCVFYYVVSVVQINYDIMLLAMLFAMLFRLDLY